MVLSNFKSYAGEQRIGPFHKSFSAVVGSNGSGKSNVIDAMLFVFGKRAKQHDGAQAELTDALNQMESIKEKIRTKESYIVELQEKIEKHQSEASESRKVEQECRKQKELLIPLEQEARQKVTEIKSTRDSEKNQSTAAKAIMQAKESNEIQGIYGRLCDLGAIDANSAQACIELLRRRNRGERATCFILKNKHTFFIGLKRK